MSVGGVKVGKIKLFNFESIGLSSPLNELYEICEKVFHRINYRNNCHIYTLL